MIGLIRHIAGGFVLLSCLALLLAGPAAADDVALLPHVATNDDLMAVKSTAYTTVIRDGFTTPGDGGAATYTASNVACPLNAGAGDNGSQVMAIDGGCFIADLRYPLDPRMWGKSNNPTEFYATPTGADVTGYCLETNATCSPQHALDIAQTFTNNKNISVINLAAGTATVGLVCSGATPGSANGQGVPNNIWIVGAGSASTIIADASAAAAAIIGSDSCRLTLQDFSVTSLNGAGLFPQYGAVIGIVSGFKIGATHFGQFHAEQGGTVAISAGYTISGGAPAHLECVLGGRITYSEAVMTVTLTGTPAYSTAFADLGEGCIAYANNSFVTYSGAATGSRFKLSRGATMRTEAGSATYLPGNALGTLIDDGNYQPVTGPTLGAPTGLGTGGSPGVVTTAGSSDKGFVVQLSTGSTGGTPASTGTIPITFGSKLGLNGVACPQPSVSDGSASWGDQANVSISGPTSTGFTLNWKNYNAGALTALATSKTYYMSESCRGY